MYFLFFLIPFLLAFNPQENDLKVSLLLGDVPNPRSSLDLNFDEIYMSTKFKKNLDKFGYILNIDEIPEPKYDEVVDLNVYNYYQRFKTKVADQVKLIQQIISRAGLHSIFLVESASEKYLVIVDKNAECEMKDLIWWLNMYELSHWGEDRWSDSISYGAMVKFVKVGLDPWI